MPTPSLAPPPPPPSRSHPSWNSLVSDITMSEDEEGQLSASQSRGKHSNRNHRYPQQQQNRQQKKKQQPFSRYQQPLIPTEDSAASLLEYSQSSEEGHSSKKRRDREHARENSSSSTSFRFRDDLTQSTRIVRLGPSSDAELSDTGKEILAAEEGAANNSRKHSNNSQDPNDKKSGSSRRHRHHHHEYHRGGGATVNRETFLSTPNSWMTQLAYSFATPPAPKSRKSLKPKSSSSSNGDTKHKKHLHQLAENGLNDTDNKNGSKNGNPKYRGPARAAANKHGQQSENSPLLSLDDNEDGFPGHHPLQRHSVQHASHKLYPSSHLHRHSFDSISIAVTFLKDFEAGRPHTLPSDVSGITPWQMGLYRIKFSTLYSLLLGSAMVTLFLSSAMEGPSAKDSNMRMLMISALNMYALVVFATDMWIRSQFQSILDVPCRNQQQQATAPRRISPIISEPSLPVMVKTRASQASLLTRPLFLFGIFLALENVGWLLARPDRTFVVLYSSVAKPLVLYYASRQARHAMEALIRITRTVIRVLVIELVLILSFAAVACRLFPDFESFHHLSVAWLSLFKLATTVVNPSIWMPTYEKSHWSAAFFVLFIVVTVFYMHSLVLSVVFQTYIQAATEIHDRYVTDREASLQLAFHALKHQHQLDSRKQQGQPQSPGAGKERIPLKSQQQSSSGIPMYLIREALESLRPHYSAMKINALVEFFDTKKNEDCDYPTFRSKVIQALNASIRTSRVASPLAMSIELTAVVVAMINFGYVILLTSDFDTGWFDAIELELGALITIVGVAELVLRTNPMRVQNFTPMTRFNSTFDGLAIVASVTSCFGIGLAILGDPSALEYILMGRAVDMIRVMRFFQIFRDVVRRSSEVVPALLGPIALVMTMLHLFVYIGMALWGGAIEVGVLDQITPLYDLNNFNSYMEGMVTMFQVLVVNDWHAIAEVFLYASRCSSPAIVYPFFILGNLFGVSILLNVITAFFVESFVSKLGGGTDSRAEQPVTGQIGPSKEFSIQASGNGVKRASSLHSLSHMADDEADYSDDRNNDDDDDDDSSDNSSELFEFDVYEREGYDRIISTVVGAQDQDDFARQVCNQLELFESLTPGREKVGYLVCCQQTMNRYGNRRFETEAAAFVDKMELHGLVSDMHSELLALLTSSKESYFQNRSLVRVYPHPTDPNQRLELSATILRRSPALSLFVNRIIVS